MLCKVTHCAGRILATTRPHQLQALYHVKVFHMAPVKPTLHATGDREIFTLKIIRVKNFRGFVRSAKFF